ncbi:MAG: hypothetical protein ACR2MX_19075 [Cyclobacteriaceae bacterium]
MANLDSIFPNENWVVYYDLQNKKYHIDGLATHKRIVTDALDKTTPLLLLRVFDSHQEALEFVNVKKLEDLKFISDSEL